MFYVVKKMSKNENEYIVLYADLGYRKINLTFDRNTIAEILGVAVVKLNDLPLDKPYKVEVK